MPSLLELTKEAYAASLYGPFEDFVALLHDDVRIEMPPSVPHGGSYRGKAGAYQLRERLQASWSEFSVDIGEYFEGQDAVMTLIELHARNASSGNRLDIRIAELWRFQSQKIVELSAFYFDTHRVFELCKP